MTPLLAFGFGSGYEWLIVLAIVLILFGNRIPAMARNLGSGIVEFKKGLKGDPAKSEEGKSADEKPPRVESSTGGEPARHNGADGQAESDSTATAKGDG